MMAGVESIRDVIAFPKTQRGQDLLVDAPSPATEQQLRDLHIKVRPSDVGQGRRSRQEYGNSRRTPGCSLGFIVALALLVGGMPAAARGSPFPTVALTALPTRGAGDLRTDSRGRTLPLRARRRRASEIAKRSCQLKPRGYYHEYTVRTPGAKDRGARRIVCGGAKSAPDSCYYTDDHYQSFRRIRE